MLFVALLRYVQLLRTRSISQNSTCLADFDRSRTIRLITQKSIDLAARTRSISQNSFNLAGLDRFRRFISLLSVMAHHSQEPRGEKKLVAAKELSSATGAKVNMPQIRDGRVKRCQNDTKVALLTMSEVLDSLKCDTTSNSWPHLAHPLR